MWWIIYLFPSFVLESIHSIGNLVLNAVLRIGQRQSKAVELFDGCQEGNCIR